MNMLPVITATNIREVFEREARKKSWYLARSERGYYSNSHVESSFEGFCMAHGINHINIP